MGEAKRFTSEEARVRLFRRIFVSYNDFKHDHLVRSAFLR